MIELAQRAIVAHGGMALWEDADEITVELSAGGLAFASKLQGSAVRATNVRISTRAQHVVFEEYPREGRRGVLEPDGSVRIETNDGEVLQSRANPRDGVRGHSPPALVGPAGHALLCDLRDLDLRRDSVRVRAGRLRAERHRPMGRGR